jgi:hypothetical protein
VWRVKGGGAEINRRSPLDNLGMRCDKEKERKKRRKLGERKSVCTKKEKQLFF